MLMNDYDASVLQSQIDALKLFVVISLILICLLFYLGKRISEAVSNNQVMIEKINRDNELRYEDIKKFVCPKDIKHPNEKCKECVSRKYKKQCWTQHFIEKLRVPSSTDK